MNAYLIPGLSLAPAIVKRLTTRIQPDRLDARTDPDRFSPREVIAHLADWEPIMRDRIAQALSRPGSTLAAYDEVQMAIDHNYASSDPCEQMARFIKERERTIDLVKSVSAKHWGNTVVHPERGDQSASDLANLLLGHDTYHIEQLSAYLP